MEDEVKLNPEKMLTLMAASGAATGVATKFIQQKMEEAFRARCQEEFDRVVHETIYGNGTDVPVMPNKEG